MSLSSSCPVIGRATTAMSRWRSQTRWRGTPPSPTRRSRPRSLMDGSRSKGVTNRVLVKPAPHYKDVKAKITEALHRQAQIDARRIWLTTDDGHVTLHGHVSSWSEAAAARKAAESAPGVTKVESQLTITP